MALHRMRLRELIEEMGGASLNEADAGTNFEKNLMNKLDRMVKHDEIDTSVFGLETDDGKIVKVYVKQEQADDFEKALAEKLGEDDDIEGVLNELSMQYEIVDVEWPTDDEPDEKEGSEALDPRVYKTASTKLTDVSEQPAGPTASEDVSASLSLDLALMEDGSSIESRLNTTIQHLVYQGIVDLGIPEIALNRSPYRSAIIKGIKDTAARLTKNPVERTALKTFLTRVDTDMHKHHVDSKKDAHKPDAHKPDAKHAHKPDAHKPDAKQASSVKPVAKAEVKKPSLKADIEESLATDFWVAIEKIISYIAGDAKVAKEFFSSPRFEQLVNTSSAQVSSVSSQVRRKLDELAALLEKAEPQDDVEGNLKSLGEGMQADEAEAFVADLLRLIDPSSKRVDAVIDSQPFVKLLRAAKLRNVKLFNGLLRTKLEQLKKLIGTAEPVTEGVVEEWSIANDKGTLSLRNGQFSASFSSDEEIEQLLKAISNKSIATAADDEGRKVVFSPRGSSVLVKRVGETAGVTMNPADVETLLNSLSSTKSEEE